MKAAKVRLGIRLMPAEDSAYKGWIPDARNRRIEFKATIMMFKTVESRWAPVAELPSSSKERLSRVITFSLKSSAEKGVCMNYPKEGNSNPDLFFACPCPACDTEGGEKTNPKASVALDSDLTRTKDCPTNIVDLGRSDNPKHSHHYSQAKTTAPVTGASVWVRCEDFGAYGSIEARAEDCEAIPPVEIKPVQMRKVKINLFKVGDTCYFCGHRMADEERKKSKKADEAAEDIKSTVAHEKTDLLVVNAIFGALGMEVEVAQTFTVAGDDYLMPNISDDEYKAVVKRLGKNPKMKDVEDAAKKKWPKKDDWHTFWPDLKTGALVSKANDSTASIEDKDSVDVFYVPRYRSTETLGLALRPGAENRDAGYSGNATRPVLVIGTAGRRAETLAHELGHALLNDGSHLPSKNNLMADNATRFGTEVTPQQKSAMTRSKYVKAPAPPSAEDSKKPKSYPLRVPFDEDENDIADAADQDKVHGVPVEPFGDGELIEGNDNYGDGLTNYEEYRGFIVLGPETARVSERTRRIHVRTSVEKKDLFLRLEADDEDKAAALAKNPSVVFTDACLRTMAAEGIEVHLIPSPEFYNGDSEVSNEYKSKDGHQRINFNATKHTLGAQHGVRVVLAKDGKSRFLGGSMARTRGITIQYTPNSSDWDKCPKKRGCPETTNRCVVNEEQMRETEDFLKKNKARYFGTAASEATVIDDDYAAVLCHELFHAVGVKHHSSMASGDTMDDKKHAFITLETDVSTEGTTASPMDRSSFAPREGSAVSRWYDFAEKVTEDAGKQVVVRQMVFDNEIAGKRNAGEKIIRQEKVDVFCEVPGKWTSGDQDCIMRYVAPEAVVVRKKDVPDFTTTFDAQGKKFAFIASPETPTEDDPKYSWVIISRQPHWARAHLCTSSSATGTNVIGADGQEWKNDATFGNCKSQIRIRDWEQA